MKIYIKTKPNARENKVTKIDETHYAVAVKALPKEGEANSAVVRVLAEYLGIAKSRLSIKSGKTGKQKVIEVL